MGKRKKICSNASEEMKNIQIENKKITFADNNEKDDFSSESVELSAVKNKKPKKSKEAQSVTEASQSEPVKLLPSKDGTTTAKTKKKNKASKDGPNKNKIIKFSDNGSAEESHDDKTNNQKKPKDTGLSQEDDVKDEDIDKFCDEINEEDNQQYEDWVKLIEAKLTGSKKKPK
ncbi:uncharacterized protein LOC142979139 [Anticarsia gemmatalis]|uniref:uncharacterized protein LOC142979139 n=1 Tax=Anticarsia gemmatalis TaxID=129554 RepID=UPI003F77473E